MRCGSLASIDLSRTDWRLVDGQPVQEVVLWKAASDQVLSKFLRAEENWDDPAASEHVLDPDRVDLADVLQTRKVHHHNSDAE